MIAWLSTVTVSSALAVIVTVGGFLTIYLKPELKTETIGLMTLVLAYYFGSSKGSAGKDAVIAEVMASQNPTPQPPPPAPEQPTERVG